MHDICGAVSSRLFNTADDVDAVFAIQSVNSPHRSLCEMVDGAHFAVSPKTSKLSCRAGLRRQGDLLVVADARIDDRERLLDALELSRAHHDQLDDTALIAAAYRRWSEDCPHHLIGDYAFAIYDRSRNQLFCARDHIGARPFFYALDDEGIVFASDSKALLASPRVSDELDEDYIATALLHRRFEPRDRSFYRAIRRLDAGHCLTVTANSHNLRRHWRPENAPAINLADDAAYVAAARALLDQVVDDHLVATRNPAIHLSGGLDSSLVAAIAVPKLRDTGRPDPTGYCWHEVRPDAAKTEEPGWTEAIRARLRLRVEAPELSAEEMADLFARDWTCEPDVRNLFHEAAIQRDASADGVDVILSGWGGDEGISFNGRGLLPELLWSGRWRRLFNEAEGTGVKQRLRIFYGAMRKLAFALRPDLPASWRSARGKSLIAPALLRRARLLPIPRLRETSVRRTQLGLLEASSVTARLEDWAISGRRHGIEYRFPLLDRRVLEFAYGLPPHLFRQRGRRRWLMREIAKDLLPDSIRLNDSKKEPIRCAWLERAMSEAMILIDDRLNARDTPPKRARYVDMAEVRSRLAAIRAGTMTGRQQALRLALQFLDLK